ncbi:MAG: OmpW family outer membrane protein [Pseudomonadota bacterium]
MQIKKIIKPLALTCLVSLPGLSNAAMSSMMNCDKCNFVDVKVGVDQPTNLKGNSTLSGNSAGPVFVGGIAVGRKFMDTYSVDLEFMHKGTDKVNSSSANGDTTATWGSKSDSLMVNFAADLMKEKSTVTPYVKAGIGASRNKSSNYITTGDTIATYNGKNKTNFAWQVGAGFNVETNNMMDTQIQYMFVDRGKMETVASVTSNGRSTSGTARNGKLRDHVFTIGFKFKF